MKLIMKTSIKKLEIILIVKRIFLLCKGVNEVLLVVI